ncbi:hypothetical protein LPB86_18140 [Pedobacter sp. MC2016-14]|uniref:sigma factor-like helix-turn-helix DNA-binding protein n=1 Tax=Pedobacter sp. MC2016-14 TaxID=2897327 RepID=UPI001E2EC61B|nr:sigma factor-like helix-turn-helix DNA-binding protein [Pedobacter sp. MC2016-14]MCD0490167.1 hypothetical protein [Pedobacter sp. MC2016-14]
MVKTDQQIISAAPAVNINILYDKYAGMLLGHVFTIVKDLKLAEEYLVLIFCELAHKFNHKEPHHINNWCQLQRFAMQKLTPFTIDICNDEKSSGQSSAGNDLKNTLLDLMNEDEKYIFCAVYYHGKNISKIALQLNKSEDSVRKILKQAFAIMRIGIEKESLSNGN